MIKKIKAFFFQNRSTRQTIAKNIFWLTMSQVLSRVIRALIIIYAARALGATQYGIFSYALGLAAFFTIFADVGISMIMTREIAKRPESWKEYFATSFWIKSVLLLITSLLIVTVAPFFSKIEEATKLLPLVALLTIFDGVRELITAFFRAKEKMEMDAFANVLTNSAIVILGFMALRAAPNYSSFTLFYVLGSGVGALLTLTFLGREFFSAVKKFSKKLVFTLFQAAWPVAISAIFGAFMMTIDIVFLGWWRTAAEVGFYSSAQKVVQIFYTMPAILASSIFPTISRLLHAGEKDGTKIQKLMEKGSLLALIIAVPMMVGGAVLAKSIIVFLYGAEYLPAASVFRIFVLTFPLAFLGPLFSNMILAYDKQKMLVKYLAASAVLNVVLDAVLIPKFGIVGSAMGTLVIHTAYAFITWGIARKTHKFHIVRQTPKIAIAALFMGVCAFIFNSLGLNVLVTIFLSGICYLAVLYVLRETMLVEIKTTLKMIKGTG